MVMADGLRVDIQSGEITRALQQAAERLANPRDLLARIGAVLEQNVNLRFDTKTDPDGVQWLPIAESTRKAYEKRFDGRVPGTLLQRALQGAAMSATLAHNVGEGFVEVGFSKPYAQYHETGTRRMPRRGMLAGDFVAGTLGQEDALDVMREVDDYLAQLFS
jgi:phage virion morphogenesis protein